jgi:hypothetical protein
MKLVAWSILLVVYGGLLVLLFAIFPWESVLELFGELALFAVFVGFPVSWALRAVTKKRGDWV